MIKILSIGNTYIRNGVHSINGLTYAGGMTNSPMESFRYIIENQPDVVVFATTLGNLNDITVYQRIRKMYASKDIPIILLVHEEDEDLYEDFYDDGITIGLHPDIEEEILFLHIDQLVRRCRESKNSILVLVEDSAILNTYSLYLNDQYFVFTASNAKEAVNWLMTEKVDVILTDVGGEKQQGIKFLRMVVENTVWQSIPVIVQTDVNNLKLVSELKEKVTDCLLKPVGKDTLLKHLDQLFYPAKKPESLAVINGRKRILLVDKEGINFSALKNVINEHYDTIHGLPGVRPISIMEAESVDCVIVNLDNALFCLNKIIEKALQKHIPVLLCTSEPKQINELLDEKTRKAACIEGTIELPVEKMAVLDKLELAI